MSRSLAIFLLLISAGTFVSLSENTTYIYHDSRSEEAESLAYVVKKTPYDLEALIKKASPAVVRIDVSKKVPVRVIRFEFDHGRFRLHEVDEQVDATVGTGSGFFVTPNGYLVTNRHVIAYEDATYRVDAGKEEYEAHVIYRDPVHDLAILKVEGKGFPILKMGSSSDVEIDDPVVAMGNALGKYTDSSSYGKVSGVEQDISVDDGFERRGEFFILNSAKLTGLLETTAETYPGDSGGPLLNEEGVVVGINVATTLGVARSYAVPAELAIHALRKAGVKGFLDGQAASSTSSSRE